MNSLKLLAFVIATVVADEQALNDFAEGNKPFIDGVYRELAKKHPQNFLVCPLSVQTVFALLGDGAKGNTAKQIITSLHLPQTNYQRALTFDSLGKTLQTNSLYILTSANKIYVSENVPLDKDYQKTVSTVYHTEIQNIDFGRKQEAVEEVNKWVEEKTHEKIKNLLNEEMVGPHTTAVLVNALYFQGQWKTPFNQTARMPFYLQDSAVFMNMMKVTQQFSYYDSLELKAKFLELPYEGDEMSMTIVLPNDSEGFSALESQIFDVLTTPKYETRRITAYIPKFTIDTTISFTPILQNLGVTDAFTPAADFSGISHNLMISEVVQKAFIEVDQKGTTAAAASAVAVNRIGGGDYSLSFIANHPFIFYLKHRVNGVIFIGRYSTPGPDESEPWLY